MTLYGDYASKQNEKTAMEAFASEITKLNKKCLEFEAKLHETEVKLSVAKADLEAERQRRADLAFSVCNFVYSTSEMEPDTIKCTVTLPPTMLQADFEIAIAESIKRNILNERKNAMLRRNYSPILKKE